MSRVYQLTALTLLVSSVALASCSDRPAQAQNNAGTRAQIRESLGNAPSSIDTTTAVRLSAAFRGAAEQVLPAVVHVGVTTAGTAQQQRTPQRSFPFPFFDDNEEDPQQPRRGRGTGSGFVIDPRGYILTNHHVVANADRVTVTFVDGREYAARVVGADPNTDVGVIKIEPRSNERFATAPLGSSDETHVGDWVIAIGNPLTLQFSVTAGIVSAKGRNLNILERGSGTGLESFIQTDAAINPGNSGGPLIDLRGNVIGINSAIESPTGFFAGAGFAIPIDLARKVADDILEFGHVRRPRLGVGVRGVSAADAEVFRLPSVSGAVLESITPGQPAARAGIEMGDVVVGLNGHPIRSQAQFMEELARLRPRDRARLDIIRYGQRMQKTVELGEFENTAPRVAQRTERPRAQDLLGFSVVQLTPELSQRLQLSSRTGVIVQDVDPYSGAFEANLGRGAQIISINGREINSVQDVERIAQSLKPGQLVTVIARGGDRDARIFNYRVR